MESKRQETKEKVEGKMPEFPPKDAKDTHKRQEINEIVEAVTLPTTGQTPKQQLLREEAERDSKGLKVDGEAEKTVAGSAGKQDIQRQGTKEPGAVAVETSATSAVTSKAEAEKQESRKKVEEKQKPAGSEVTPMPQPAELDAKVKGHA
ncbi:neurofilament heavy polypeptide-like [Stegastes partitus]|uniref:Neurofilament heavy polypeptide-like n=1 Tax=Stegastes partitus TaxID=144197 RepID=A0A9Y4NSX0_9TELE|nr:PREDICTED: neurofilament heavy polypeptide-like [Stegastes partitus]